MRHCYLFSIKNRFSFFKPLILQLKDIYKSFPEKLFISVTDFNSDDACISTFLSELDVDFSYRCFDENFNLGKGWNLASEHEEISNNDILVFLTNDTTVGNIDLPATIEKYTNQHNSIFIPVHAMETKNKDLAIMAVDNLPSELPRDSSREFGDGIVSEVIPYIFNEDDGRILNATITQNGSFLEKYNYLNNYIKTT